MSIKARVDRVEKALGGPDARGRCSCPDCTVVHGWDDGQGEPMQGEPPTEPIICPVCGGEKLLIVIEYGPWPPH